MTSHFKRGERVAFRATFLRSTGQYTGDPAPTSWGPFARGAITNAPHGPMVNVDWDNGERTSVLDANLILESQLHTEV